MKKYLKKIICDLSLSAVLILGVSSCSSQLIDSNFVNADVSDNSVFSSEDGSARAASYNYSLKSTSKYYKPREFNFDMYNPSAKWSWSRCKESEHFYIFWDAGFGSNPNSASVPAKMRVDIDAVLTKAEQFYNTNVNKLKMVTVGQGKSQLDRYKMQIYLLYQEEWLATGSGYDNVIGALWVNPTTCQPVGATIAHEIGHSFQYQVYCDQILNGTANNLSTGFRYGISGGNDGNTYWEQCAQWQSFQDYPAEPLITGWHRVWMDNYFRHFHHEKMRYGSYFFQYYLTDKHGIESYSRIWKESRRPEDAIEAYKRLFCSNNNDVLNANLYEYSARLATYDFAALRPYVSDFNLKEYNTKLLDAGNGYSRVSYENCLQPTGVNVIPVSYSGAQEKITVNLRGLPQGSALVASDSGRIYDKDGNYVSSTRNYNNRLENSNALWNFGFVAYNYDGSRTYTPYSTSTVGNECRASYVTTGNEKYLYLVVSGATKNYVKNTWDNNDATDMQLPYEINIEKRYCSNVAFDRNAYTFWVSSFKSDYPTFDVALDPVRVGKLCDAFGMSPDEIKASIKNIGAGTDAKPSNGKISLGLKQADGSVTYYYTATKGFYFTSEGNLGYWNRNATSFIEFDVSSLSFKIGCDGRNANALRGQTHNANIVLTYMENGRTYTAEFPFTFVFK